MAKEKRFVEDYNEQDESEEEPELDLNKIKPGKSDERLESELEEEEIEESEEDVPNIFEDNFSSFSPAFKSRTSSVSASLESEPVQNLERGLHDVPTAAEPAQRTEEPETPMMYNAPQYGSGYDTAAYEAIRNNERIDVTGGAATANLGREINMKRWQETAMGHPQGGAGQGEQYIRAPEKQRESRGLPFERGNQRRNVEWKEEY